MMTQIQRKKSTLEGFISHQMESAVYVLPEHMTPERMIQLALGEFRKNPKLKQCTHESLAISLIQMSALGLEPGSGDVYMVPYGRECTLIVGYQGMMKLVRRTGNVLDIGARLVREGDEFSVEIKDGEERYFHQPDPFGDGKIRGGYAYVRYQSGLVRYERMSIKEIEKIRDDSKGRGGPWATHFTEMARKTLVRRLCKWIEISPEDMRVIVDAESGEFSYHTQKGVEIQHAAPLADDLFDDDETDDPVLIEQDDEMSTEQATEREATWRDPLISQIKDHSIEEGFDLYAPRIAATVRQMDDDQREAAADAVAMWVKGYNAGTDVREIIATDELQAIRSKGDG